MLIKSLHSHTDLCSFVINVKTAVARNIPIKKSHLQEAIARGCGKKTYASLNVAINSGDTFAAENFNHLAFIERLAELSEDRGVADAAANAIAGIYLNISITRRSPIQQREDRYSDVAYDVVVEVGGVSPESFAELPIFMIPTDFPRIRLASAWWCRGDSPFPVTHNSNPLTAKFVNGRWEGGMYLDIAQDADDSRCIRSVSAALARTISSAISPWVRCAIFHPDHYDVGAWRIEMSLGHATRVAMGNSTPVFDIPQESKRLVVPDKGNLFDLDPARGRFLGKFVDGIWYGHIYSNGIAEHENPVSIEKMRMLMLHNVSTAINRSLFS